MTLRFSELKVLLTITKKKHLRNLKILMHPGKDHWSCSQRIWRSICGL